MPLTLPKSLAAWDTPNFNTTLKAELEAVDASLLPLQQGLSLSSYVSDSPFSVMPIAAKADADSIHASVGVFYTGIIAGCSCADDPTPMDEQTDYCQLRLDIERESGAATVSLLVHSAS